MKLHWFGLALLIAALSIHAEEPASAADKIDQLHEALYQAATSDSSCAARLQRLEPLVDSLFAMEHSARRILGRHWKTLDPAHRARFVEGLKAQSALSHTRRFDGSELKGFVSDGLEVTTPTQQYVRARLLQEDRDDVMLEYEMWLEEGRWRVFNITADGVSELDMRSAQYRAIFIRDGADALLDKMEQTVREQRKRCAEAP